jgi:hypothetical protein
MVMIAPLTYVAFSVLLAVLATASTANAQTSKMSYTFSGTAVDNGTGGFPSHSVTLDVGPTTSPFVVIAIHEQNGHQSGATVTVGDVSLTRDFVDGTGQLGFYSGVATGTSGNQTVTFTQASSSFETVGFSLWYFSASQSLSRSGSGNAGCTINVAAGDSLFAISEGGTVADYSESTVTPNGSRVIAGDLNHGASADWAITSSDASFRVSSSSGPTAAATYASTGGGGSACSSSGSSNRNGPLWLDRLFSWLVNAPHRLFRRVSRLWRG